MFAERGFKKVTVREICRAAGANVAAVNYHFGDKQGLYELIVDTAIDRMRETTDASQAAGEGRAPADKLRAYVGVFLHRVLSQGRGSWIYQLMSREMADPTPALDRIVDAGIRPRIEYARRLVAELLGCSPGDERVWRLVAGIHAECLFHLPTPVSRRLRPGTHLTPTTIDGLADHIAEVSLAGIRALARRGRPGRRSRRAGAGAA